MAQEVTAALNDAKPEKPYDGPAPNFAPGQVISTDSLVVDRNGVAWFVSPGSRLLVHAETRRLYRRLPTTGEE
jgi:hypothetical protein